MRVLQIIQRPQLRGAEIFACQLAQELVNQKINTDVVYLFGSNNQSLEYNLNFIALNGNPLKRLWDFKAYKMLSEIIRLGKYDIIQANAADTLKYAVMSKMIFGWKAKLVFRNASLMGRLMHSFVQKQYNRWLLSECDQIISVSENCRQDLMNFYPGSKKTSTTIPSGTLFFEHVVASVEKANHQRPIFLHAGSFVWEKNHEFLLRIFQAYLKHYQHGTLWLLGDGKLQAKIKERVQQMRLQDHVIFWGYRKDIPHIIKSADVLLMPSVVEGMPGVILESLSCGTPVIASHVGGIPEVIQNDVNGFCVSDFDEDEYVKHMYILATDDNVRLRFIKAGRQAVEENFNIAAIAKRFLECYSQLITNNGS